MPSRLRRPGLPIFARFKKPSAARGRGRGFWSAQVVTKKARGLIEEHGLSPSEFASLGVVRASDVEEFLKRRGGGTAFRRWRRA